MNIPNACHPERSLFASQTRIGALEGPFVLPCDTNGSQLFITVAPTQWLTGKHTIFGEVVEGQDIVDKISKVPRGRQDRPNKDVKVNSVVIERV